MKSNFLYIGLLVFLLSNNLFASEQLIVVKTNEDISDLKSFAKKNNSKLKFSGSLSFGKMYVLNSDKVFYPKNKFNSDLLIANNSLVSIGPSLIMNKNIIKQNLADQDFSDWQWALHNTGLNTPIQEGRSKPLPGVIGYDSKAFEAWQILHTEKKEVVIAIIDSGIDINHQDLKDHIWTNSKELNGIKGVDDDGNGLIDDLHGYSFISNSSDLTDEHGHGTHCAGIIAADHENHIGIMGLASGVKILPIKIFNSEGNSTQENLIKAIDYAVKMHVDVISASWGGGPKNEIMFKAIEVAKNNNIMFIAAAGNENTNNDETPFYPASYDLENIISVAAHNNSGNLAYFSNYGLKTVHISAPGQFILSTLPNNKYAVWSGTSMATPYVSAAVAMLIQQEGALPISEIKTRLIESSIPQMSWRKNLISMGRLNLLGLLEHSKIDRGLPKENEWKVFAPTSPLYETQHPITDNNLNLVKDYYVPGAKYVRLVFSRIEITSSDFPLLRVRDPISKSEPESVSLNIHDTFKTDYIIGDKIGFRLNVHYSGSWGIRLESIEYQ